MHPHLPHLLNNIANAHRIEQPYESPSAKTFEEEMDEIERWCEGEDYEHSFSYYCGLQVEDFPPPEQLTTEEIIMVNKAFRKMMFTYNHDADFPEALPAALTYSMLVKTLNEKTCIPADGFVSFDYCSGYAPDCVFKEYCSCLKLWNAEPDEDISDADANSDELPF
jgi:hypothetical protein